ncbi:hypothetical protein R6Q59_012841 [Mikania micrantha]
MHESETSLSSMTAEIRKEKQLLNETTKSVIEKIRNGDFENIRKGKYFVSSLCGFSFNKLDFGWGKPTGTSHAFRSSNANAVMLMDTVDDDGIEAMVFLEKECMEIFENDKEMLSYCLPGQSLQRQTAFGRKELLFGSNIASEGHNLLLLKAVQDKLLRKANTQQI